MLFNCNISNKDSILAQSNKDLLDDYVRARQEVSDLLCKSDFADYDHEDYWHKITYAIEQELLRRMGE